MSSLEPMTEWAVLWGDGVLTSYPNEKHARLVFGARSGDTPPKAVALLSRTVSFTFGEWAHVEDGQR